MLQVILRPIRLLTMAASFAAAAAFVAFLIFFSRTATFTQTLKPAEGDHEQGFAYRCEIPAPKEYDVASDNLTENAASRLQLFEDDRELGPAHSLHEDIRKQGRGRFSHWGEALYFSASDNSDPATNGRTYRVRFPATAVDSLGAGAAKGFGIAAAVLAFSSLACGFGRKRGPTAEPKTVEGRRNGRGPILAAAFKALGWALVYMVALTLIDAAFRAQRQGGGGFKINFEYRVF